MRAPAHTERQFHHPNQPHGRGPPLGGERPLTPKADSTTGTTAATQNHPSVRATAHTQLPTTSQISPTTGKPPLGCEHPLTPRTDSATEATPTTRNHPPVRATTHTQDRTRYENRRHSPEPALGASRHSHFSGPATSRAGKCAPPRTLSGTGCRRQTTGPSKQAKLPPRNQPAPSKVRVATRTFRARPHPNPESASHHAHPTQIPPRKQPPRPGITLGCEPPLAPKAKSRHRINHPAPNLPSVRAPTHTENRFTTQINHRRQEPPLGASRHSHRGANPARNQSSPPQISPRCERPLTPSANPTTQISPTAGTSPWVRTPTHTQDRFLHGNRRRDPKSPFGASSHSHRTPDRAREPPTQPGTRLKCEPPLAHCGRRADSHRGRIPETPQLQRS